MLYTDIYVINSFAEKLKAKDDLWIVGDDFVARHMTEQLIRQPERLKTENYAVSNFGIYSAAEKAHTARNTNLISRFRNSLVHLINRHMTLPKYIVVIPESDIIDYLNYDGFGVSTAYGRILDWLMYEFRKIISGFKDQLPDKSKRINEPHIMWIQCTRHVNYRNDDIRGKFNHCLKVIGSAQENTSVYFLQQLWERKNNSLVLLHNGHLTFTGVCTLWSAIDRTIRYGATKT